MLPGNPELEPESRNFPSSFGPSRVGRGFFLKTGKRQNGFAGKTAKRQKRQNGKRQKFFLKNKFNFSIQNSNSMNFSANNKNNCSISIEK